MANPTALLPMLEIMGGFTLGGGGLNPSNKVFNPTNILLQPSYFVFCFNPPKGFNPPELFLPLLLNK
jgi:hypothetical protein